MYVALKKYPCLVNRKRATAAEQNKTAHSQIKQEKEQKYLCD